MMKYEEDRKKTLEENIKNEERIKIHRIKEEAKNKKLYLLLGEPIWTNGYVSDFIIGGYFVSLCNQIDRFVGEMYRVPTKEEINNLKGKSVRVRGTELSFSFANDDIKNYFDYSIISSDDESWNKIIKLLEKKI